MGGQRPVGDSSTLWGSHCPPGEAKNKGKNKIIFSLFYIYNLINFIFEKNSRNVYFGNGILIDFIFCY